MPFRLVGYNKNIDVSSPDATKQSILDLVQWVTYEFQGVAQALLSTEADQIWHAVPPKPQAGTQAYADGTNWNPGAGEGYYEYTSGGAWVPMFANAAVRTIKKQIFVANGTYTPSAGMLYCIIECMGGGGGGGAVVGTASSEFGGGGGGSGGYSRLLATAAVIGASKAVTVGAGGNGGAAGAASSGLNGGVTSVGSLCIANGGIGGTGASSSISPGSGGGAAAGTGDLPLAGAPGFCGTYALSTTVGSLEANGGNGGGSYFGGGGAGALSGGTVVAGGAATIYGAGGGGAAANLAGSAAGGQGGPGIVFITEFCSQ